MSSHEVRYSALHGQRPVHAFTGACVQPPQSVVMRQTSFAETLASRTGILAVVEPTGGR